MSDGSPFTLNRFEYEQKHLYFLQRHIFQRIERPKPIYLIGSRGTGKTTLLKSLDWRERRGNDSLREQLSENSLFSDYLGVYLKLPEFRFSALRSWLGLKGSSVYATIFSAYLDLVWLQSLTEAIAELVVDDVLDVSAAREQAVIRSIVEEFPTFGDDRDHAKVRTLKELGLRIRRLRERIEYCAILGTDVSETLGQLGMTTQVGELGKRVGDRLSGLCKGSGKTDQLYIKVCMDEGECLDDFQRKVLNTMVRLAKSPVFFVTSFVNVPSDLTSTLEQGLQLQEADRDLIMLDKMSEVEFRELSEGVATVRVRDKTKKALRFDSRVTFGELDMNAMLQDILADSVSPKAKQFLADAETQRVSTSIPRIGTRRRKIEVRTVAPPPIYETYLARKLALPEQSVSDPAWLQRKQESAEFRKRIVAAYLSICREVNASVRYASADMVLQMSDMCIRDFLHQVHCVFAASRRSIERFVNERVPTKFQTAGLETASTEKFESIPSSGVNSPAHTGRVIHGLGRITAEVQSTSANCQHLRSSERGVFVLEKGIALSPSAQFNVIYAVIREAAEAGFLRIVRDDDRALQIRLHTSLAAAYGFSYRGAYYPVRFQWDDLMRLAGARDVADAESIADQIYERIEKRPTESLSLFDQ